MVTPRQPKEFLSGLWTGEGELLPHRLLRWLIPCQRFRFFSEPIWLLDSVWLVRDRMEFTSGRVL